MPNCARWKMFSSESQGPGWWTSPGFCVDVCAWMRVSEKWGWVARSSLFFPPFSSFFFNYIFLTKRCGPWPCSPDSPPPLTREEKDAEGSSAPGMILSISGNVNRGASKERRILVSEGLRSQGNVWGARQALPEGPSLGFPLLCFLA